MKRLLLVILILAMLSTACASNASATAETRDAVSVAAETDEGDSFDPILCARRHGWDGFWDEVGYCAHDRDEQFFVWIMQSDEGSGRPYDTLLISYFDDKTEVRFSGEPDWFIKNGDPVSRELCALFEQVIARLNEGGGWDAVEEELQKAQLSYSSSESAP